MRMRQACYLLSCHPVTVSTSCLAYVYVSQVHTHMCVHVHMEALRLTVSVFLGCFPPYSPRQGHSVEPEVADMAGLAYAGDALPLLFEC